MPLRIEDLDAGMRDLRDELVRAVSYSEQALNYLSDGGFQAVSNTLSLLGGRLETAEALRRELVELLGEQGRAPGSA